MKNFLPVIFLLTGFVGCLGVEEGEVDEVPVTVELPAAFVAQSQIGKIVLTIRAADIPTPITAELTQPIPSTPAFSVSVPPGSGREFEVIVTITSDPKSGFQGKVVTDISTAGGTVPIDMEFVNFTDDLIRTEDSTDTVDSSSSSINPDINFVKIVQGSCTKITDAIIFVIDLEDNFFPSTVEELRAFIEFDVDVNSSTGSNPTKIEREKGSKLTSNFLSGSEVYLSARITPGFGTAAQVGLFNAVTDANLDPSIPGDATPPFGGTYSGTTDNVFSICVYRRVFDTFIDADNKGAFNILIGMFDTGLGIFRPNDIAYRSGLIFYDLSFDTSSL